MMMMMMMMMILVVVLPLAGIWEMGGGIFCFSLQILEALSLSLSLSGSVLGESVGYWGIFIEL